ncbi:MAG TPA: hypothetical protein VHO29_18105 [Marmoricola sp.]|nr:hypothetical protein [Marmoricola sp.]
MRTTSRLLARAIVAALLVMGCWWWSSSPALADDGSLLVDVPGDGVGFTHQSSAPLLDVQQLYPGGSGSGTVDVRNTSAYDADLVLVASNVDSEENGCLRPETRVPTERCDADGGELQNWLVFTVSRVGDPDQELWHGDLAALSAGADLGELGAGAASTLRVQVLLPAAAGNDTMTDSVSFDTRLTATTVAGESTVAGPQVHAGGAVSSPRGPEVALPMMGGTVSLWWLVLEALVLMVGTGLVIASRLSRPSRSRSAPRPGRGVPARGLRTS